MLLNQTQSNENCPGVRWCLISRPSRATLNAADQISTYFLTYCHYWQPGRGGGGGYSRQFRIGVCRQGSQTLTLVKGRKSRIDILLKAQNQEMAPYLRETR